MKLRMRMKLAVLCGTALLLALGCIPVAMAAKNDIVNFPDNNLKLALIAAGADQNNDGELTRKEMASLSGLLGLSEKSISDLSGISSATGISGLDLGGNAIGDISELSGMNGLESVDLSNNNIGDISALSGLTGLKEIDLSGNGVYDISVLYNVEEPPETLNLETLDVSDNYLNVADGSADRVVTDALISAGCAVTFDPQKPIPASGVALNAEEIDMCPGDTATLSASVLPEDAVDRAVTWQGDQPSVAEVNDGVISAAAVGTAAVTVTAQDGGWTDTCRVNVKENKLFSDAYETADGFMYVPALTVAEQFQTNLGNDADDVQVLDQNGDEVPAARTVATGMTVTLTVGGIERDRRTIVVQGDVNGDGVASIEDYTMVSLHLKGCKTLEGADACAADYDRDGLISEADSEEMRLALAGPESSDNVMADLPDVADPRVRAFLDAALAQLGKPYVWGAEGPDTFDCSGFVCYSLRQAGYDVKRLTADMYSRRTDWAYVDKDDLQPGDLMFYYSDEKDDGDHIGHIGIYLGNGYHIHASSDYGCVIICGVQGWYKSALAFGRRVFQ